MQESQDLITKLDSFVRKYYKDRAIRGLLYSVGLLVAFFLSATLLEYFGRFGIAARTILFWGTLLAAAVVIARFIAIPLLKLFRLGSVIRHEEAARIIGTHFGEVKDKLLNTLQLRDMAHAAPDQRALIEAAIAQRSRELGPIPFVNAIDLRRNTRHLRYALPPLALLLVLLLAAVLRVMAVRRLRARTDLPPETVRKWIVNARNGALVVATKELILCLSGAFYRLSSRAFSVGDRIEVGGHRGVVIDGTLLSTTLLEYSPSAQGYGQTGRSVVLPNSLFLSAPLLNESFGDNHLFHLVRVPLFGWQDVEKARVVLLESARAQVGEQRELRERWGGFFRNWGLPAPELTPEVTVHLPEPGRVDLMLRVPCLAADRQEVEQGVLRRFLGGFPSVPPPPALNP